MTNKQDEVNSPQPVLPFAAHRDQCPPLAFEQAPAVEAIAPVAVEAPSAPVAEVRRRWSLRHRRRRCAGGGVAALLVPVEAAAPVKAAAPAVEARPIATQAARRGTVLT